ncbi:mediator of DNA damage checkpoint protein 1-like isoform X2 [Eurosta solidaginis]|uniref:mediator of DNA damage checkpoint protein 1-like isoform X2 n=1 Tax=Eurosta solidaginis TaxID=178769 RepID=UPI0035305B2E
MLGQKWTLDVEANQYELLHGKLYLIGGSYDNGCSKKYTDIILKSPSVDAKHCVLDATGTTLCLYDLYSELGTFVNGKRLESMLKECIYSDAEICIGEVIGCLYLKEQCTQHKNNATEIFLLPTQRAPRSLSNTSTRLFSSPDVSLSESTAEDCSFNIPETQHIQQRVSIEGDSSLLNTSAKQSIADKSVNDDSFIPETQLPTATDETRTKNVENLIQQSMQQDKTDELIRMCTQDFQENLFGEGVDDDTFTSLIIPNIRHTPVILAHDLHVCNSGTKDNSKASSDDAEIEALNWSAQTSKGATTEDSTQHTQCLQRDDVCTPDLFDFPELVDINVPVPLNIKISEHKEEIKTTEQNFKTPEKAASNENITNVEYPMPDGASSGDGYAEEINLTPTQVFIPKAKPRVSYFVDSTTQDFISKPKQNEMDEKDDTENVGLSLSGKENMPHTDFCLEQTQIFPIQPKESNSKLTSSCANKAAIDAFDRDVSLLPPTQLFSTNYNDSSRQHTEENKTRQNLNSTPVPIADTKQAKNVAIFFADMDYTTDKAGDIVENRVNCFKKPKQSSSSTKSTRSREAIINIINCSQSKTEDIQLCTPKWIVDNFDELTVERNVDNAKKRMLFGSDSEDEPDNVELNNLVTKKDSKDFERLLANVKDAKPLTKVVDSPKTLSIKQEKGTGGKVVDFQKIRDVVTKKGSDGNIASKQSPTKRNVQLNSNITDNKKSNFDKKNTSPEKGTRTRSSIIPTVGKGAIGDKKIGRLAEKQDKCSKRIAPSEETNVSSNVDKEKASIERERPQSYNTGKQHSRSTSSDKKTKEQSIEKRGKADKKSVSAMETDISSNTKEANANRESTQPSSDKKDRESRKRSTSNEKKTVDEPVVPAKRVTRLRSKTSDIGADRAVSSTSAPSEPKKCRVRAKEENSETERLTRSRSKTDSQESITSTKSSRSTRSTKKVKSIVEEKKQLTRKNSCSETSAGTSKSSKPTESKGTRLSQKVEIERKRKISTDNVSSDDETKRLRSTTRTLQVAMTMVEPKLFQCLLENSPGNWCLASDPTNADVLVMDKGNRTLKFLIAMAKGIPIVNSKWLESLNSTKTVPRGITFFFRDKDFENRHKFSLLKSLDLARKHKIFEGYDFLTTPSILPQPAEMKQIIECAGGKVHNETPLPQPNQKIYLISSWNDKKHWHKYRRSNANIRITSSEGIMESVMRQITTPLETHIFV